MTTSADSHFVFVDFENVSEVDLRLVAGKSVRVMLLIGKNQAKLDFNLVEQIHRLAAQVELVKLDASGRNALDLTLAYYLGRAVDRSPDGQFSIVSKDKDFDPMVAHLVGRGIKVVRCDSFVALPFLPKTKKSSPAKVGGKASAPAKTFISVEAKSSDERLEKLVHRLRNDLAPRPKKKTSLLAHINTAFGGRLAEPEQNQKLDELINRGILIVGTKDKVTYGPAN